MARLLEKEREFNLRVMRLCSASIQTRARLNWQSLRKLLYFFATIFSRRNLMTLRSTCLLSPWLQAAPRAASGKDKREIEAAGKEEEDFLRETVKDIEDHVNDNIRRIRATRVRIQSHE